jgi:hypothetical protein
VTFATREDSSFMMATLSSPRSTFVVRINDLGKIVDEREDENEELIENIFLERYSPRQAER